jgi:hypothetical protein
MTTPAIDLNKTLGERYAHLLQPGATITEEEAQEIGTSILRAASIPIKVWSREDLDQGAEDNTIEGRADEVADELWANRGTRLKQLGDCTDTDWQIIADAARDTANDLGLTN